MHDRNLSHIRAWLLDAGMDAIDEAAIVSGFAARCNEAGMTLSYVVALIDTLHPIHEGRVFRWGTDSPLATTVEYGPTIDGDRLDLWQQSAFYHLFSNKLSEVRRRIGFGEPADFSGFAEARDAGHTDVMVMAKPFSAAGSVGEMDCFYSSFSTRSPTGFSDQDLDALRALMPALCIAIKCVSVGRIARTIAEVYLGKDAAERVLAGKIRRGVSERISSVLWYSDLTNFTQISDTIDPNDIIPFLNDYAEAAILSVEEAGGTVLKLVGDGVLAIFNSEDAGKAGVAALSAKALLAERLRRLNAMRSDDGKPTTDLHLGLHVGDTFYGNIGSDSRLDFTVIGPAVNEVCRIASMCRTLGSSALLSSDFLDVLPQETSQRFSSVGHHVLRGVSEPIELFTRK